MSLNIAHARRPLRICLLLTAAALALGGCAKDRAETTGSISPRLATNQPIPDWRQRAEVYGE